MEIQLGAGQAEPRGFVRREWTRFWAWYEKNYTLNVTIALGLFALQLLHLLWLTLDVVALRLVGTSFFPAQGALLGLLVIVDLFEIPALFSVSLVYINELRQGFKGRALLMLLLLNSQWLHILWITDEFVIDSFSGSLAAWPLWLAWVAILIDYLELPVMWDTLKRFMAAMKGNGDLREALKEDHPGPDATLVQTEAAELDRR